MREEYFLRKYNAGSLSIASPTGMLWAAGGTIGKALDKIESFAILTVIAK